ncbi:MAG: hypothetical protein A4E56_02943 [Pelotomaculum sp. PtaU1.Bin065]|nr:MAG: hypothetical protein A4E56_02943 [Pelotomaculum sp. PtaU1.Bin065]
MSNKEETTELVQLNNTRVPWNKAAPEFVAQVLDEVLQGEPISHIAKRHGISRRVISKWIIREAQETRQARDGIYALRMNKLLDRMLEEADNKDLSDTSLRDLVVAMGIIADKREKFYSSQPSPPSPGLNLRVMWANNGGAAAIEVTTSGSNNHPPVASGQVINLDGRGIDDGTEILEPLELDLDDDDPRLIGGDVSDETGG